MIEAFKARSTSYLAEAISLDVEMYEMFEDEHDKRKKSVNAPSSTEVDFLTSILMGMYSLMQQQVHYTAAQCPPKTKKAKVKPLPVPKTAKDLLEKRRAQEANNEALSVISWVSPEEYQRMTTELKHG